MHMSRGLEIGTVFPGRLRLCDFEQIDLPGRGLGPLQLVDLTPSVLELPLSWNSKPH